MFHTRRIDGGASEARLEALIAERLEPGADKARIDARVWDLFGEELAVMFTDLSGFSRRVAEFGIIHFLQVIYESQRLLTPVIESHDGILLKTEGDSLMVIFRRADRALECALAMQRALRGYNEARAAEDQVLLCVGLGYGRVLRIGDRDVFGAEVNASAKLGEDTARPWEILVTRAVRDACGAVEGVGFAPIEYVPPGADAAFRVEYALEG